VARCSDDRATCHCRFGDSAHDHGSSRERAPQTAQSLPEPLYLGAKWVGSDVVGRLLRRRFKDSVRIVHMHSRERYEAGRPLAAGLPPAARLPDVRADGTRLATYDVAVMIVPALCSTDHLEQLIACGLPNVGSLMVDRWVMRHKLEPIDFQSPPLHHSNLRRVTLIRRAQFHVRQWLLSGERGAVTAARNACKSMGMSLAVPPYGDWPMGFMTFGEGAHAGPMGNLKRGNDVRLVQMQRLDPTLVSPTRPSLGRGRGHCRVRGGAARRRRGSSWPQTGPA